MAMATGVWMAKTFGFWCVPPFATEVENPDFVAFASHLFAHATKCVTVQVAGCADEADYARPVSIALLKDLP